MADSGNELLALGRTTLAAQPFSQLLRLQLERLEPGEAELRLRLRPELLSHHGAAHGGVVDVLADTALAFAGGSLLGPEVATAEFKINHLRKALGAALLARAVALHAGRHQVMCRCDVFAIDATGTTRLCAAAQGSVVRTGAAG